MVPRGIERDPVPGRVALVDDAREKKCQGCNPHSNEHKLVLLTRSNVHSNVHRNLVLMTIQTCLIDHTNLFY